MKVLAICGYSGSGKTTLLKKLIPYLVELGIRIGVLKHTHHDVEIDIPGKDSYELRKAGAQQTIVAGDNRYAIIHETKNQQVDLITLINKFTDVDLVLVEGFKDEAIAKIICYRHDNNRPLFTDSHTLAIASDIDFAKKDFLPSITLLNLDDIAQIATFIKKHLFKQ